MVLDIEETPPRKLDMTRRGEDGLTQQQLQFCLGVLSGKTQSQAAADAGYSIKGNAATASDLMRNPKITAYIAKHRTKQLARIGLDRERILAELARIGFSDLRKAVRWGRSYAELVPSDEMDEDTALAVAGVKAKVRTTVDDKGFEVTTRELDLRMYSKVDALAKLAKFAGLDLEPGDGEDEDAAHDAKAARIRAGLVAMDEETAA